MSKTALFFPGQASQYVGMGRDLYDYSAHVRQLYELASDEIGADIAKLSFEGPADSLKQTRFTQPSILLHSLAVLEVLKENLPMFHYAAGHSLGEYGALVVTGVISAEDAIKAVVKRASLMEIACQENPGTMAAILGLDGPAVEEVCEQASSVGVVVPANFNSQSQIAISGEVSAIEKAMELAKSAGAKRAIKLEVGGAFHSPLMEPARIALEEYLRRRSFTKATHPVIANVTGQPVTSASEFLSLLVDQVTSPVKWSQSMGFLTDSGVTTIIEIGPGKVLTGLAKRDMQPTESINLDTLTDIESFIGAAVL
jgi:[acyl-carrier-protein] S-malonyltransferase